MNWDKFISIYIWLHDRSIFLTLGRSDSTKLKMFFTLQLLKFIDLALLKFIFGNGQFFKSQSNKFSFFKEDNSQNSSWEISFIEFIVMFKLFNLLALMTGNFFKSLFSKFNFVNSLSSWVCENYVMSLLLMSSIFNRGTC